MAKYFLRTSRDDNWREVTKAEFIQAEREADFLPNHHDVGEPATAAFSHTDDSTFVQGYTDPLTKAVRA